MLWRRMGSRFRRTSIPHASTPEWSDAWPPPTVRCSPLEEAARRKITRTRLVRSASATDISTLFGEVSATRTVGRHTWVAGGALQREGYDARDVPRFNYTYTVPGVFVQDEFAAAKWLTLSGSARVDRHSRIRDVREPARVGAGATVCAVDDTGLRRPRVLRPDAVYRRDRSDRPFTAGSARCARRGARRQHLGRRDVGDARRSR